MNATETTYFGPVETVITGPTSKAPESRTTVLGIDTARRILERVFNPSDLGTIEPTLDADRWHVWFRNGGTLVPSLVADNGYEETAYFQGVRYTVEVVL